MPRASPKLLNLDQKDPQKYWFFWSDPYIIEVMITYDMLKLPNVGHMIISTK